MEKTGAEFNQIMNMIDQGNQQQTPQEATDYILQQVSPTYRDMKTNPDVQSTVDTKTGG